MYYLKVAGKRYKVKILVYSHLSPSPVDWILNWQLLDSAMHNQWILESSIFSVMTT